MYLGSSLLYNRNVAIVLNIKIERVFLYFHTKFDKRFCIVLQTKTISKWQQEAGFIENNELVLKVAPSKWKLTTIKLSTASEEDIRWNIAIYRTK